MSSLLPNQPQQQAPDLQRIAPLSDLRSTAHLSDLQIDDHLIGDLAAEPATHLANCTLCSERVSLAEAPLASFQSLTLAWSERRSATLPPPELSHQRPLWHHPAAWISACFALTLGIALTSTSQHAFVQTATLHTTAVLPPPQLTQQDTQPSPPKDAHLQPVSAPASRHHAHLRVTLPAPQPIETARLIMPPRAQQISADNRMLQAIDAEFSIPAAIPSTLGLTTVSEPVDQTSAPRSLQD